jgi:hypothetical protein
MRLSCDPRPLRRCSVQQFRQHQLGAQQLCRLAGHLSNSTSGLFYVLCTPGTWWLHAKPLAWAARCRCWPGCGAGRPASLFCVSWSGLFEAGRRCSCPCGPKGVRCCAAGICTQRRHQVTTHCSASPSAPSAWLLGLACASQLPSGTCAAVACMWGGICKLKLNHAGNMMHQCFGLVRCVC